MYYRINIAHSDDMKRIYDWINNNPDLQETELITIISNKYLIDCLLTYQSLLKLKCESFGLVSSNAYGYSTHYLYKLKNESIVVINCGIDGKILNVKKTNDNFEDRLRQYLDFIHIDLKMYNEEIRNFEEKINPECKFET